MEENDPSSKEVLSSTPKNNSIMKSFSFTSAHTSLAKSDSFMDFNRNEIPHGVKNTNNRIEVITVERRTPKLIYEPTIEPLGSRFKHQVSVCSSKSLAFLYQGSSYFMKEIWPRLKPIRFTIEVILSNFITVISAPIILLWIAIVLLVRQGVSMYLKIRYKDKYKLMGGADAAWGVQWYANDNCFLSLYILEGECSLEKIRNRVKTSLIDRTESNGNSVKFTYERMRQKITQKCGFFCWEKHPEFDIKDHVKLVRNDPTLSMTDEDIFKEIQGTADKPLDGNLPQWEILVVPNFIYRNRNNFNQSGSGGGGSGSNYYAMIWRINHSIMDGISAVSALNYCVADNPVRMAVNPMAPLDLAWYHYAAMYLQILLFGSRSFIKTMITNDYNCFHGPKLIGPKTIMWSRPVSVQTLKQVKNTMDSSTTAVLLSAIGGSLRNLAELKNLPVPEEIIGGATALSLPYPKFGPQNRFTVASFKLKVGIECRKERLKSASQSVKQLACAPEIVKNFNMIRLAGLNPVAWIAKLMDNLQATFLLSNVPGPVEHCTMFQGDRLVDVAAWNTIKGKTAIGVCLISYAGKLRAGVIGDSAVLSNSADVPALIQHFEREMLEVARICGIPEEFVFL